MSDGYHVGKSRTIGKTDESDATTYQECIIGFSHFRYFLTCQLSLDLRAQLKICVGHHDNLPVLPGLKNWERAVE